MTFSPLVRALLLAGTLAACGDGPSARPEPSDDPVAAAPSIPEAMPAPDTVANDTAEASRPGEATALLLAVDGEGLRAFDAATGAARPIPFGVAFDDAITGITAIADASPRDSGETPDCGLSYASWENGLTITGRGGRFVGWSLRPSIGDQAPTTASGIGVGSTRAEIDSVYDADVTNSSLGIEFSAGGMAGVIDAAGPDGRVVAMWAGEVCIAR